MAITHKTARIPDVQKTDESATQTGRPKASGVLEPVVTRSSNTEVARTAESVSPSSKQASNEDISRLAYKHWEERGKPEGSAAEDWQRAEAELSSFR